MDKKGEKKYTKMMIIISFFFIAIAIVFAIEMIRFVREGSISIQEKTKDMECERLNFKPKLESYRDGRLVLSIESNNLEEVTVVSDTGEQKTQFFEPTAVKEVYFLNLDILIDKQFSVYPNKCLKKEVLIKI